MRLTVINEFLRFKFHPGQIVFCFFDLHRGRKSFSNVALAGNNCGNVISSHVYKAITAYVVYNGICRDISLHLDYVCLSVISENVILGEAEILKGGSFYRHLERTFLVTVHNGDVMLSFLIEFNQIRISNHVLGKSDLLGIS